MSESHRHRSGFKRRTRLPTALETLRSAVAAHGRTERRSIESADGRVLAASVEADRDVPHYARAAMDGYAVRARDTFGASDRSPSVLHIAEAGPVDPEGAVRVHTGSAMPDGADAVVMIEHVERVGDEVEVVDAVAEGENVGAVGEDVERGQHLFDAGHRLRPSDLGLLRAVGRREVEVVEPPTVAVVPTGEELVGSDPAPGEIVETNGLTVSRYVDRWGGRPTYREIVPDDPEALRVAIQRDLTKDIVVTTGGSSVGERDLLPEVVDTLGEVLVHGVALRPGHPVAIGRIEETPIVMLPGYPVACIVNAVQFLRPALKWCGGMPLDPHPTVAARLERKIRSEPGTRTFARVSLERPDDAGEGPSVAGAGFDPGSANGEYLATPTRASGAGVLSSVALADGWVVVPEDREGIPAGETVPVERWEWSP